MILNYFIKKKNYLESSWFKFIVANIHNLPIILTWKNNTVDYYNSLIRNYIHKTDNLINYLIGDTILFNNYYVSSIDKSIFYTSNMVKIIEISEETKKLYIWEDGPDELNNELNLLDNTFTISMMKIETSKVNIILTISLKDLEKYKKYLDQTKNKIESYYKKFNIENINIWNLYYQNLIDPYAEIIFSYSLTVYKSQGSTYDIVLIDMEDMIENKTNTEFQKALYTAVTRANKGLGFIL